MGNLIILKSALSIDEILENFRTYVYDKKYIQSLNDDKWLKEDLFIGEQIDATSFWILKKDSSSGKESLDFPLSTSPIKAVVTLERNSEQTIVLCRFEHTVCGYILAMVSLVCLFISLYLFSEFFKNLSLLYFVFFLLILLLTVICAIGFFFPYHRHGLLNKIKEIIKSD